MNNLKHIDINLYFKEKVILLRNELIDLGTFNPDIKEIGKNLTENFAVFASGANKNLTTTYKTIRLYNKIKQN